jgi:hypothetical protein
MPRLFGAEVETMRRIVAACFAVVCTGALLACSSGSTASSAVQSPPPSNAVTAQERARDMILAAELELRDLRDMKARTVDEGQREAIDRQMAAVAMRRDALQGDLAVTGGKQDGARLHADTDNLEHSLRAGAAAEMQGPEAPPPQPQPIPPTRP